MAPFYIDYLITLDDKNAVKFEKIQSSVSKIAQTYLESLATTKVLGGFGVKLVISPFIFCFCELFILFIFSLKDLRFSRLLLIHQKSIIEH